MWTHLIAREAGYGLPWWLSGKESACNVGAAGSHGLDPWVGKILWKRAWQPVLVFLTGESHRLRNLEGYSPGGRKESDMTEQLSTAQYSIYGLKNMKLVQEVKTNRQIEWNGNLRGERKTIEYQGT